MRDDGFEEIGKGKCRGDRDRSVAATGFAVSEARERKRGRRREGRRETGEQTTAHGLGSSSKGRAKKERKRKRNGDEHTKRRREMGPLIAWLFRGQTGILLY
jgi:hypothetical protein